MIKISIVSCCCECGFFFNYEKEFHTQLDAENAERRYARKKKHLCPDCYRKNRQEWESSFLEALYLPELTGSSEKQVNYAHSLRKRYILKNASKIEYTRRELDKIDARKLPEAAEKRNLSIADCVPEAFRQMKLVVEYICLTESTASRVIEALKEKSEFHKTS